MSDQTKANCEFVAIWQKVAGGQGHNNSGTSLKTGYYKLSTDQGNAQGHNNYGTSLQTGFGVDRDLEIAVHFDKLSADQGNADGQLNSGICLD
jgi:TPR repeat protein